MNIHTVDLNLLVVFEAIYQKKNITQAADSVGLSQSAASNALTRLRRTFNDALFVRTSRGMSPTPYADELIIPVRDALALLRNSFKRHDGFDAQSSVKTFTLRLTDMGEMMFLPPIIERLKATAPGVRIKAVQAPLAQLHEGLETGEIDIALGFLPGLRAGMNQKRLLDERYVCAIRSGHTLGKGKLTLAKFRRLDHILITSQGSGNEMVQQAYQKYGLMERCVVTVPHFVSVPHIIAKTDLAVTIPSRLAHAFAKIVNLKIMEAPIALPALEIRQLWHQRFENDPANKWLRGVIASVIVR